MRREARARRNVGGHFARQVELPIGRLGQQNHQQVFERYHPDLQLHELGVGQRRSFGMPFRRSRVLATTLSGAAFDAADRALTLER